MSDEFYDRGLKKAQEKDYPGAIEEFTKSVQLTPYFADAFLHRGLAYYDSGAIHQAVSDYTEAVRLNPESMQAYYCRGLARLGLKNLPGALHDVDMAIRLNYHYAPAHHLRGIIRRKQGFINDAIANFKQAAELYLAQKDTASCRLCMEKIKELQPSQKKTAEASISNNMPILSTKAYFTQLLEKAEKGNTREAIADLNWILQADSQDAHAYCCRGVVHCKMGKYQDAIADFNQALSLNLTDAVVYRNRGKARSLLGDHQGAMADFNQALKIQPQDTLVYVARGNAYRICGNYLDAIQDYSQALQINPDYAPAYYNRGLAYTCLEEMPNAVADYQKAAQIFCENEDWDNYHQVLSSLQRIQKSTPEIRQQDYNLLRQRVLRLVGGYWEIAQRLIDQKQEHFPGMSDEWYLQQIIADLERDRNR
ncbi:tetratricopeptide repeat protein [Nodularia chucula]|uniref:tetratricopeptide repeat protein n=1 Tax=Nodularia chucula TaxID=3093667 RepID=UPI0039C60BF2